MVKIAEVVVYEPQGSDHRRYAFGSHVLRQEGLAYPFTNKQKSVECMLENDPLALIVFLSMTATASLSLDAAKKAQKLEVPVALIVGEGQKINGSSFKRRKSDLVVVANGLSTEEVRANVRPWIRDTVIPKN